MKVSRRVQQAEGLRGGEGVLDHAQMGNPTVFHNAVERDIGRKSLAGFGYLAAELTREDRSLPSTG